MRAQWHQTRLPASLARVGNAFPDSTRGYGWQWDDLGEYYGAGIDELIFNEGTAPTTHRSRCPIRCATVSTRGRRRIRRKHISTRYTMRWSEKES